MTDDAIRAELFDERKGHEAGSGPLTRPKPPSNEEGPADFGGAFVRSRLSVLEQGGGIGDWAVSRNVDSSSVISELSGRPG